jgi:hypothetical protein
MPDISPRYQCSSWWNHQRSESNASWHQ